MSSNDKSLWQPFFSSSFLLNKDDNDTVPLDSLDSNNDIGYIFKVEILPVPVWLRSPIFEVGPVNMKCPCPGFSSQ